MKFFLLQVLQRECTPCQEKLIAPFATGEVEEEHMPIKETLIVPVFVEQFEFDFNCVTLEDVEDFVVVDETEEDSRDTDLDVVNHELSNCENDQETPVFEAVATAVKFPCDNELVITGVTGQARVDTGNSPNNSDVRRNERIEELQNEVKDKEKKVKEQEEKIRRQGIILEEKLEELKKQNDRVKHLENNDEHRKRVVELEANAEVQELKDRRLREELESLMKVNNQLKGEGANLTQQYEAKLRSYDSLVVELEERNKSLSSMMVTNHELREECNNQQSQISELMAKVRTLEDSLSFHFDEKTQLKNQLKTLTLQHDQQPPKNEVEDLRTEFENFKKFTLKQFDGLYNARSSSSSEFSSGSSSCSSSDEEANNRIIQAQKDVRKQLQAHKRKQQFSLHDSTPPPQSSPESSPATHQKHSQGLVSNNSGSVRRTPSRLSSVDDDGRAGSTKVDTLNLAGVNHVARGIDPLTSQHQHASMATSLKPMNKFSTVRFATNSPTLPTSPVEEDVDEAGTRRRAKVVPGPRNYSDVTKDGEETIIFSNSITKGIRVRELNHWFDGEGALSFRRFPGGLSHHVKSHIPTYLEEVGPKSVIIQSGGNDLPSIRGNLIPISDIASNIIESGEICRNYGAKNIFIAEVPVRLKSYIQERCHSLNALLKELCEQHDFTFLDNSNITTAHLYQDGVHLNNEGSDILANNYLSYLNYRYWELQGKN